MLNRAITIGDDSRLNAAHSSKALPIANGGLPGAWQELGRDYGLIPVAALEAKPVALAGASS